MSKFIAGIITGTAITVIGWGEATQAVTKWIQQIIANWQ